MVVPIWNQFQFTFRNGSAEAFPVDMSEKANWIELRVKMQLTSGEKSETRMIVHKTWDKEFLRKRIEALYMNDKKFWEHNREERKLILPKSFERN
jgi:hypothetical protein